MGIRPRKQDRGRVSRINLRLWSAHGVAGLSILLALVGGVMTEVAAPAALLDTVVQGSAYTVGFGAVGWLLWHRLPHNPIGWCFAASALLSSAGYLAHGWAALALNGRVDLDAFARGCAAVDTYAWLMAATLGAALPLLLLPDGQLPSPRWRPVLAAIIGASVLGTAGFLTVPGRIDAPPYQSLTTPLGLPSLGPLPGLLGSVGVVGLLLGSFAGVVSLVRRYRRVDGLPRQQLRWVGVGGVVALLGIAVSSAIGTTGVGLIAGILAANAMPVCIAVAVLRYRLYDLGRLVSRTVTYAAVTGLLVAAYVGLVTVVSQLTPSSSSLSVAASTLTVAALFKPVRERVQRAVDRRFNRARFDAELTVDAFRQQLREQISLDRLRVDLLAVTQQTMQPASTSLWLRDTGHALER